MKQDFLNWVMYFGIFFISAPILVATFRYRFITQELRCIIYFLGLSVLTQIVCYVLAKLIGNNLPVLHLYTILEFNIIALFYFSFFGYFYSRKMIPGLMVLFTVFAIFNSLFIQKITEFNTYARSLESILIVVLSILCFYKILVDLNTKNLTRLPIFWINTGFLLYFAGNFVLFILSNVILKENKTFNYMSWGLHSCLLILLYMLIAVGLWFSPHQK